MTPFRELAIDRKLLSMSLVAASAALLLACISFLTYDSMTFREILARRMAAFADIVGVNSASAVLFNDPAAADRTLRALEARTYITAAAIYTVKGELFAHWLRDEKDTSLPSVPSGISKDAVHFGVSTLDLFHPVVVDRSNVATVYIRSDLSERSDRLQRLLMISGGVLVVSVLLAAAVSLPLGRRISKPLLDLARIAQAVSRDRNYSVRARSEVGGEVGLLVSTFNEMLVQIQQRGQALQAAHDELEQKVEARTVELRRKEEELNQSRRLEAVGRLAGGVAHDFNNLLTGIIGCSETLEEEIPSESPLAIEVQEIRRAAERASSLTRQLLAFGRKQIISPQSLDVNALVHSTAKLLGRLIGEDIVLVLDLNPDLGKIRADPGQMDQIILNIAVNARDAMPHGGKLYIRTRNVRVDAESDPLGLPIGDYIMLSLTDTGSGMTKDVQAQIFEPFFTTKERGKGTGLGLATVYGIIKQNQGAIEVFSHPGMGTTFKVFLPQESGGQGTPSDAPKPAEIDATPEGTETILLVEDEALVSNHVARLLRRKGYTVLVASSGRQALAVMEAQHGAVDLVLTDVIMPEMNGRELVQELRKTWPDLRALFMSGYPAEIIAQHGVLETGIAFIEKPFHTSQICRKIREILDA